MSYDILLWLFHVIKKQYYFKKLVGPIACMVATETSNPGYYPPCPPAIWIVVKTVDCGQDCACSEVDNHMIWIDASALSFFRKQKVRMS